MAISDPKDMYKVLKTVLESTGSWPKRQSTIFYKIRKVLNIVISSICIILVFIQSIYDFEGVQSITHAIYVNLEWFSYIIKALLFFYKTDDLFDIFQNIEDPVLKLYDEDLDKYMKKRIWISSKLALFYLSYCCVALISIGLLPFFGHDFNRDAPYPVPIDFNKLPLFVYVSFWLTEVVGIIFAGVSNISMDMLACSFMAITSAHLEILREKLKRTTSILDKNNLTENQLLQNYGRNDDDVLRKIKNCVDYYVAIERLVISVDNMFNDILLIQIVDSVLVICLTSFTFILYPIATIRFLASFLFFFNMFVQLAIYFAFGNDVIVQSSKITEACYMSEWWSCDKEVRKSLFIIMERAKRPYQFTAGKFIIISLSSFLTICKSSFSYLTVLNRMYTKSESGGLTSKL